MRKSSLGLEWRLEKMNKKNAKSFVKTIGTILVIIIIISVLLATIFIRTPFRAQISVAQYKMCIQFMACDYNITGSYVIQNESYAYRLRLGSWTANTSKSYPAAFAIVNPQNISLTIRKIEIKGDSIGCLRVYLHKNYTRPCNSSIVQIASSGCEPTGDYQKYYEGSSIEYSTGGWRLGPGLGYTAAGALIYTNGTTSTNASFSKGVWYYNETYNNTANNNTANFVWAEVDIVVPSGAETVNYENAIIIFVECLVTPEPGPEVDFMACDRLGGGYVLTGYTNRSVLFNLGSWMENTSKSFPGAFAIVNTQSVPVRITQIEVLGDASGYLRVYLHKNHTMPCNSSIVAPGTATELTADMQLYYDGSSSILWTGDGGWRLGSGLGYNATGCLTYTNGTGALNATRIAGFPDSNYYFWLYNESAVPGANLAINNTANFVWIEIDVVVPPGASAITISGELIFYFKSA